MDWQQLFDMQRELDTYIQQNHEIQKKDLTDKKILALSVELGELANETKCFKFWSKKQPSEREVILEEYVDGIHFLLSIGLDNNYFFSDAITVEGQEDLTHQFNRIFSLISSFGQEQGENAYQELFGHYMALGRLLGFSAEDVHEAYVRKNEINHQRQDTGY